MVWSVSLKINERYDEKYELWDNCGNRLSLPVANICEKRDHNNSPTRYDPSEKKYRNKRCIPWQFVPERDTEVPGAGEHRKAYRWWPVAILQLKDDAVLRPQLEDWMFVICVYQAMLDQPVVQGLPITQLLLLPHFQDTLLDSIQHSDGAVSAPST